MSVMTMARPHSGLAAQAAEDQRHARARDTIRKSRTELLHLPWCRICGGATEWPVDTENPDELRCVCADRATALEARLRRLVGQPTIDEHVDVTEPRRAAG